MPYPNEDVWSKEDAWLEAAYEDRFSFDDNDNDNEELDY